MKRIIALALATLMLVSTAACGQTQQKAETRTITDSAGDQVEIPNEVNTVINLVTFGCQVMFGLGLGDCLVGINLDNGDEVEYAWTAEMYPRLNDIEQYEYEASAESLLKADADIVFVEDAEFARDLRSKGVTAVTFSYFSIDEMKAAITMLGEILGGHAAEQCGKYISYLEENINLVASSLEGALPARESLYYINGVSNKGLYKTTGKGSTNSACAALSYTDFATDSLIESPANRVDSEAIIAKDPENIIIGGKYQHILYDELLASPEWSNNTAVVNGHVFKVPTGISAWNRYGLEIALMIPWTSAVVYPEYFEYDLVRETIDFYSKFAGYTLTEQQVQYMLEGLTPSGDTFD